MVNGKWHIDARIGSGGMATVYAATHRNGHRAALKMLHTQLSRDEGTRARFLREGYVGNAVGHPGVVHVQDDGVTEDGCAFLVLDLLEGDTIEARRTRYGGTLPLEEVLEIADQSLDALAAAHDKGIIHRDVKPENVFMCKDGQVKLLDFGLARMKSTQAEATKTGVTIGTPEFMAPEQAGGRRDDVDARSDVWALGATLFTALTGKYVHEGKTLHEQLIATATQRAPGIRALAPKIPGPIAVVIDRALELDRADRWESAREMQRAFRSARAPRSDSDKFVAESLTLPAASPGATRRGKERVSEDPISGARPSGPLASRDVTSSGRTLEMIVNAPTSDPTIEDAAPMNVDIESLPSSGPMTPPPHTERLTGPGTRGSGPAIVQAPQPHASSQGGYHGRTLASASPPGPMLASAPASPTLASALGSGPYPAIGSGSGPYAIIGNGTGNGTGSGPYPTLDPAAVIPARGSGSIVPAAGGRPSAAPLPHPHLPLANARAAQSVSPGPASLRQRRSARGVVILSLILIALCAALAAWVLYRR